MTDNKTNTEDGRLETVKRLLEGGLSEEMSEAVKALSQKGSGEGVKRLLDDSGAGERLDEIVNRRSPTSLNVHPKFKEAAP